MIKSKILLVMFLLLGIQIERFSVLLYYFNEIMIVYFILLVLVLYRYERLACKLSGDAILLGPAPSDKPASAIQWHSTSTTTRVWLVSLTEMRCPKSSANGLWLLMIILHDCSFQNGHFCDFNPMGFLKSYIKMLADHI